MRVHLRIFRRIVCRWIMFCLSWFLVDSKNTKKFQISVCKKTIRYMYSIFNMAFLICFESCCISPSQAETQMKPNGISMLPLFVRQFIIFIWAAKPPWAKTLFWERFEKSVQSQLKNCLFLCIYFIYNYIFI